jgi:SAM-dependent methyltransferase
LPECRIFGLDQSRVAVQSVQEAMPAAHLAAGDIYHLPYPEASFDVCFLMETIEHLTDPMPALREVHRVLAPGGTLYVSFPNFLNLPWLAVRILAERFNRPNWIVLQPVDKIYTVPKVKRLIAETGFVFQAGIGSNYAPPVLYKWERDWMTRGLNAVGLWWLSFHPILVFRKMTIEGPDSDP